MMPAWPRDWLTRASRTSLSLAGRVVPSAARAAWLDEWEGELWELRRRAGTLRLGAFLAGALRHAIWERAQSARNGFVSCTQDARYAVRALRRSPGFVSAAVAVLALSIGANTALFSVIEASVLARPPFPDADRLVVVDTLFGMPDGPMNPNQWSYPRFDAFRAGARTLQDVAAYGQRSMTLTELGPPSIVQAETVTPSLFPLLGITAERGRVFGPAEEDNGTAVMAVLLSHAFWTTRLGADVGVVGSTLTLDQRRLLVLGVLPEDVDGLSGEVDVWLPVAALRDIESPDLLEDGWNQHLTVVARLAPGVSLEAAREEARAFGTTITERFPPPVGASRIVASADVVPFGEARVNPVARTSMLALSAAVGLVLLIATANLAGLTIARGAGRQREIAVRVSLGAGPGRLARQLLTESVLLACVGGLLGIVAAWLGVGVIGAWLADTIGTDGSRGLEYLDPANLSINWRVLGFAAALTGGVGIGLGALPAWQAMRVDPNAALKSDARAGTGRSSSLGRSGLIVVQVAVTVILLAGASLMVRSLASMGRVELGYEPDRLLTAVYSLSPSDELAGVDPATFHTEFLERVRALPGVTGATLGEVPLGGPTRQTIVMGSEGRPDLSPAMHTRIRVQAVADGHLGVMRARLIAGRDVDRADDADTDRVMILNETAAEFLFPDGGAIGRRVQLPWPGYLGTGAVVIGIAEDQQIGPPGLPSELQAFVSIRQASDLATGVLVRTAGNPDDAASLVRNALAELNPNVALTSVMSMDARAAGMTARPRLVATLLSLFGGASLFLVAAGLYGTIAFATAQRTRELGLRASLGAPRSSLAMLVTRTGVGVTLGGLVLGSVGAFWATRYLEGLLFDVDGLDAASVAAVGVLLLVVTVVASAIPARRAMRVDPIVALRAE